MFLVHFIVGDPENFDEYELVSNYVEFDHGVAEIISIDDEGYYDDRIEVPYDHLIEIKEI